MAPSSYEMADQPLRGQPGWVQLSADVRPVLYRRDEVDGDGANCGRCSTSPAGESTIPYLTAYVARLADLPAERLEALASHALPASPDETVAEIQSRARARHDLAWQRAVQGLVTRGILPRALPAPAVKLDVVDDRRRMPAE